MKKFLCIILSALLIFNTTVVYADEHGGSSGSFDPDDPQVMYPELFDENGHVKPVKLPGQELFGHMILADPAGTAAAPILAAIDDIFRNYDNSDDSISIDKGGSTIHFHERFINEFNKKIQDSVHALDGYYLIEPDIDFTYNNVLSISPYFKNYEPSYLSIISNATSSYSTAFYVPASSYYSYPSSLCLIDADSFYAYIDASNNIKLYKDGKREDFLIDQISFGTGGCELSRIYPFSSWVNFKSKYTFMGKCFKIFYSLSDLNNYLNKGRTYAPKLPNVTIKIPVKYINNSVSLPDITYNITTENKTETEIQNQYDITIKNYLDSLDNFTDGTDPTPTPKPDGGFTDGTTPTPTPPLSDGSDDSGNSGEIIDLLKKILDKLTSFADSHSKFEKTITDYIEANDGKLDQIIEAIDSLSDGKTEDEKNGCKYDFTALSDFMTDLWNESDKKFDTMIDLLEENNKYQQKLVNSLNEIKAILITQTVLDLFTDRSSETANKAKEKFPTSLPWDIANVVNDMAAEPEPIKFTLPVKIDSLNINEEINIDLTSEEWEKLAKTCRYLLSMVFILFMIHLSRKLFSNGGDD